MGEAGRDTPAMFWYVVLRVSRLESKFGEKERSLRRRIPDSAFLNSLENGKTSMSMVEYVLSSGNRINDFKFERRSF